MKEYFIRYKPFLIFLLKFFVSYVVLTFIYQTYLKQFDNRAFEIDSITKSVAYQTEKIISLFGYEASVEPNPLQSSMRLDVNGVYVARVVEGCNALSVIILFVAFIVAFQGKSKHTFLFCIFGSIFIYVLNLFRVAIIGIALFHYPEYLHLIHGVLFPLIIYGIVFLLWVIWVNKYSLYASKNTSK